MSNSKSVKPTHLVILVDGFKVPCWSAADATATQARFAAKGIDGKIKQLRA